MHWICKFIIVLTCSVVLSLSSLSPVAAGSATPDQATPASQHKVKPSHRPAQKGASLKKKSPPAANKAGATAKKPTSKRKVVVKKSTGKRKAATKQPPTKRKTIAKKGRRGTRVAARPPAVVVTRRPNIKISTVSRPSFSSRPAARPVTLAGGSSILSRRITARSAMIMDAVTGAAIYAQSSDTPAQPASTIKVLTGVISLDALPKNALVPVSRRAAMMPRSKVNLSPGKKYPANDLINAVLLASANDASVALAEKIAGSEQAFAKLMTAKARSFGATKTVCKTANGLTASGQYTTAHDLARIFNNAMRNNEFASKMAVTEIVNTDGRVIRSHNRALWQVDGAEGGKTGYTDAARKTYVGKFKRENDEIVVSLMGSETMWEDVKKLVEYGFAKKREAQGRMASSVKPAIDDSRLLVQLEKFSRQLAVAPAL